MCDPNRMIGAPFAEGEDRMCSYFFAFNEGKEALTINLKEPSAQELLYKLIKDLDVTIFATNQLPKNYDPLGISYEKIKAVKPDIIWVGLTGFGPDSNEAAYDPVLQARGGIMDLTGEAGGEPQVSGVYLPDMGTSNHAYGEIMKALYKRAVTGEGSRIDVAMLQSTVSWLPQPVTMYKAFGIEMHRRGNTHEFFSPVSVFPTADGWAYIAVGNDIQWQRLTGLEGFESLANPDWEKNRGRVKDMDVLIEKIAECTKKFSTAALIELLSKNTIAIAKVATMSEVVEDPYIKPHLITSTDPQTGFEVTMAPAPVTTEFLKESGMKMSFPPRLGEHNEKIYTEELGIDKATLDKYTADGVI
jgi:formyl-CoA transferase